MPEFRKHRPKRPLTLLSIALTFFAIVLFGCTQSPNNLFGFGKGSLQIRVTGLPQRTVQATLLDIDHIRIELEAANQATSSQTLTKANLYNHNASASVTFADLLPGNATVSVTVYNNASASIGTTSATATVVSDQVTAVNLSLKLPSTDIVAGNLLVVGTILPGATPPPPPGDGIPTITITNVSADGKITVDGVEYETYDWTGLFTVKVKVHNGSENPYSLAIDFTCGEGPKTGQHSYQYDDVDVLPGCDEIFDVSWDGAYKSSAVTVMSKYYFDNCYF